MADSPRAGYTRTGKSLKAVRRYYALKDAARKRREWDRSPDDEEERTPRREDRAPSVSKTKRKRSPDDDKLSKRIANELRVQQEANEKRTQLATHLTDTPTDRSALPVIVTRDKGPTFVTQPEVPRSPTNKSVKSAKSIKSSGTLGQITENPQNYIYLFEPTAIGSLLTIFLISVVYLITLIVMLSTDQGERGEKGQKSASNSSIKSIIWMAVVSLVNVLVIPLWLTFRHQFRFALISLILMIGCTVSVMVYFIYGITLRVSASTKSVNPSTTPPPIFKGPSSVGTSSLNFWLPITFLIFHLAACALMFKRLENLTSRRIEEKSTDAAHPPPNGSPQMSVFLSPK